MDLPVARSVELTYPVKETAATISAGVALNSSCTVRSATRQTSRS